MQEHNTGRTRKPGFNLVELLVVVVVIGVLTAMAIVGLHGLTKQSSSACVRLDDECGSDRDRAYYARRSEVSADLRRPHGLVGRPAVARPPHSMTADRDDPAQQRGWTLRLVAGPTPSDPPRSSAAHEPDIDVNTRPRPCGRKPTGGKRNARARQDKKDVEGGFTLIELLVAIVVVGILTAVAIVGIGGLTDTAQGCDVPGNARRGAGLQKLRIYAAQTRTRTRRPSDS